MSDIDGPISASTDSPSLVGNVGQDFVQNTLTTRGPKEAIDLIQLKGTFKNPRCQPVLGLLDQLGLDRRESHEYVVKMALNALLEKIPKLSSDKLVSLLEETFPFIGITELRAVPLAVLDRLYPIPVNFVKQLARDNEVFWDLPARVQRQVWVLDKKLLQRHAISLISAYKYETATWIQGLNMDIGMQDADQSHPQLSRKMLRKGSSAMCRLVAMVGSNPDLYRGINEIFTARYDDRESSIYVGMNEAAICACRTQLLMSLHDSGEATVCATDSTFSLVWALDSCIRDRSISPSKLNEIDAYLKNANKAELMRPKVSEKTNPGGAARSKIPGFRIDEDAESAGIPVVRSQKHDSKELGEASMCLRDPSAFHLIVHEIIRSIEHCVENEQIPRDDARLETLTRILSVATESKYMFRHNVFTYPEPDDQITKTLYPCLAGFVLDAKLMDMDEHELLISQSNAMAEAHKEVVFIMIRSEFARKVIQIFSLEKLASNDLWMAESLLDLVSSCLDKIASPALPEFAPFAFTLAGRITTMIKKGSIDVTSNLWHLAVEKILLQLVDSETEAHEEILRMLLVAAPMLDPKVLGGYLDACIDKSSKSRQLHADRALEEETLPPRDGARNMQHGTDEDDEEPYGHRSGSDGVRGTYRHIVAKYPNLKDPRIAPILHAYLTK